MLHGLGVARDFGLKGFVVRVSPIVADWRAHLDKNVSTARQVLAKILPDKIKAIPGKNGEWHLEINCEYAALLKEVGADAISALLQEVKVTTSRARRGWRRAPRTE